MIAPAENIRAKLYPVPGHRFGGDHLQIRWVLHVYKVGLYDVTEVFEGPINDQVKIELEKIEPELVAAAATRDEKTIRRLGAEAHTRAMDFVHPGNSAVFGRRVH